MESCVGGESMVAAHITLWSICIVTRADMKPYLIFFEETFRVSPVQFQPGVCVVVAYR